MVTRAYFCKSCDYEFETVQPMKEKLKKKCPSCNKNKLVQDLSGSLKDASVKQYNTLGSIAEKNTKDLGTYGREAKEKAVHDREASIIRERNSKLEAAGYKIPEKKNSEKVPKEVMKKVMTGDKKAIRKYIFEGK